jgi:hypothetical protein
MSRSAPPSQKSPRILVIAADQALREFCRDGLPWAGCATEFACDIADAINTGFEPDVLLVDLPTRHAEQQLNQARAFADKVGSALIALTDDLTLIEQEATNGVQFLFRPCPPETLWDALAIAITQHDEQ